jgi:murein DD-endopeptidase MepM/ murein hydrolase activator NlpD
MRATALLIGLCLAFPALGAPRGESVCAAGMIMPPEHLREVSRGFSGGHSGIDLMAPYGSPIRAAAGGTVIYAGWYYAYGKIVDILHTDGLITRYGHMSAFAPGIAAGTPVAAGAVIGEVGMTGRAHGAHVHFEVRVAGHAVDPKPYLALAKCNSPATEPLEEAHAPDGRRDR